MSVEGNIEAEKNQRVKEIGPNYKLWKTITVESGVFTLIANSKFLNLYAI